MCPEIDKIYGNRVRVRTCGIYWKDNMILMVNHLGLGPANFWAPPGGGVEYGESLTRALEREFEEETGLKRECINNLRMKYIVLRIRDNQEIRIQYVFFGNVSKNINLIESDEGSLTWIDYKEIVNHNVSSTTKEKVEHYNELDKSTANVYVG